jgi:hypothetical protein
MVRSYGELWFWGEFFGDGRWYSWFWPLTSSDPVAISWETRADVFHLDGYEIKRGWAGYNSGVQVSTGLVPPEGLLAAATREVGSVDLVATMEDQPIWQAVWPRVPHAASP